MRRNTLRPGAFAAAILLLAICIAPSRSAAQTDSDMAHDAEEGMDETSLRKVDQGATKAGEILPPPPGMSFATNLDHTAVWVGDQFHYIITISYSPNYEFVVDNLTKETVNLDPLQVMDVTKNATTLKDNSRRLVVDMTLASFTTQQNTMTVPQFTLYYFRTDKKTVGAENAAAEALTIPGPVVALRSTLPPDPAELRDQYNSMEAWAKSRMILPTVGWICTVVLIGGIGWETAAYIKMKKTRKGPDRRKAMEAVRARWVSSCPSDFSDPKVAQNFYTDSSNKLKEFIGYYLEAPTMGLTSEEMEEEMQRLGATPHLTRRVVKVLGACETLSYSSNGASHADSAREMAQDMRDILSTKD